MSQMTPPDGGHSVDYDAPNSDLWERVKADPEVVAANAALDAHEAEEDRLTLELGRALRRARARVFPPEGGDQCPE